VELLLCEFKKTPVLLSKMEIKVLDKVFNLLEYAGEKSPAPIIPTEAALALGMPKSTCVRLLKVLTEKGFLEQLSARKGYILGPAAILLTDNLYHHLASNSHHLLQDFANELKVSVQLLILQGDCKINICGFNGNPGLNLDVRKIRHYDLHTSLSGRVLLSRACESEQKRVISTWKDNRGIFVNQSDEEILLHLKELSTQEISFGEHNGKHVAVAPLKINGKYIAAIGVVWLFNQENLREKIVERLKKITLTIEGFVNIEVI
jgi:DNA-binding IclR family transcriptional regulator